MSSENKQRKPIEEVEDHELDEQIRLYEKAYSAAMQDYHYAARNTYHQKYSRAQGILIDLRKLKKRREQL